MLVDASEIDYGPGELAHELMTALGQEAELAFHVPAGLNHGLSRVEIEEIMTHLCLYAGFPKAVDGMRAARAAFAKVDR